MNESPQISVIIPVLNGENTIEDSIYSVLSQTFRNFELIIIDDGSTDNTQDQINKFRDQRIQYIYQTNQGRAAARNTGIHVATGRYIAFLDADDVWKSSKLEKQVQIFRSASHVGVIYCDADFFDPRTGIVIGRLSEKVRFQRGNVFQKLYFGNNFVMTSTVMVRREILQKVGGFDRKLTRLEDWDMWLRLARHTQFDYLNEPVVRYRQHGSYTSWENYPELYRDELLYIAEKNGNTDRDIGSSQKKKRMARIHYDYAFAMLGKGRWKDAEKGLKFSLQLDPGNLKTYLRWFQIQIMRMLRKGGPY